MSTQQNKPNGNLKDLVLLFSIPISVALVAAAIIYIPGLFAMPKVDFIYSVCGDYRCKNSYVVTSSGKVEEQVNRNIDYDYYTERAKLYYYDVASSSSKTITLEEAKRYTLDTSSKSSDGYVVSNQSSDSGFLFWSDNTDDGWYIRNGWKSKKLEISQGRRSYSDDVEFLGWVNK